MERYAQNSSPPAPGDRPRFRLSWHLWHVDSTSGNQEYLLALAYLTLHTMLKIQDRVKLQSLNHKSLECPMPAISLSHFPWKLPMLGPFLHHPKSTWAPPDGQKENDEPTQVLICVLGKQWSVAPSVPTIILTVPYNKPAGTLIKSGFSPKYVTSLYIHSFHHSHLLNLVLLGGIWILWFSKSPTIGKKDSGWYLKIKTLLRSTFSSKLPLQMEAISFLEKEICHISCSSWGSWGKGLERMKK